MEGKDAAGAAGPSQPVPTDEVHLEGPVCRVLAYQESSGRLVCRWSSARKIRLCDCWKTYSYPDRVVLAVDDERRQLGSANRRCQTEIERLQAALRVHSARIRELETSVLEEQERTNAFREQAQAANGRLVQVVRDVRDRTDRIFDRVWGPSGGCGTGLGREGSRACGP